MIERQLFEIEGLILLRLPVFHDQRGFFLERYNLEEFQRAGIDCQFVQDNFSRSSKDVLRGLHFQEAPYQQDKLIWVTRGTIFDVAVDLRPDSVTFGRWQSVVLSDQEASCFFIPKGFAHGFVVLSSEADLCYKVSASYKASHDAGIVWNDPELKIAWPVAEPILSRKDAELPTLAHL